MDMDNHPNLFAQFLSLPVAGLVGGASVDEMREDRRLSRSLYVSMTFILNILALMPMIKEMF